MRVVVGQNRRWRLIAVVEVTAVVEVIAVRVEAVVDVEAEVRMEVEAGAAVACTVCEVEEGRGVALGEGEVAVAAGEEGAARSDTAWLLLLWLVVMLLLVGLVVELLLAPDLGQALLLH